MKVMKLQRRHAIANLFGGFSVLAFATLPVTGNDGSRGARQIFDEKLTDVEREVTGVAEAMPANRFNFAPTDGAFRKVRTFGAQVRHIGFCLNEVAVALLGEPMLLHADKEVRRILRARKRLSVI